MKKTYNIPAIRVVELNIENNLMAASETVTMGFGGDAEEGEIGEAKAFTSGSLWDDEEE